MDKQLNIKKKLNIEIDATDWQEQALNDESIISSEEDIVKAINDGQPTTRVARDLIVSQEIGAIKRVTRPNKTLLNMAAAFEVAKIMKRQRATVVTPNGNEYGVPAYVGRLGRQPVPPDDLEGESDESIATAIEAGTFTEPEFEMEPSFVPTKTPAALDYATRYLRNYIPGMIKRKLLEVHGAGGDINEHANALVAEILKIVSELTDKPMAE